MARTSSEIILTQEMEAEMLTARRQVVGASEKERITATLPILVGSRFFARYAVSPKDLENLYKKLAKISEPYKEIIGARETPPEAEFSGMARINRRIAFFERKPRHLLKFLDACCTEGAERLALAEQFNVTLAEVQGVFEKLAMTSGGNLIPTPIDDFKSPNARVPKYLAINLHRETSRYCHVGEGKLGQLKRMLEIHGGRERYPALSLWIEQVEDPRCWYYGSYFLHAGQNAPAFMRTGVVPTEAELLGYENRQRKKFRQSAEGISMPSQLGLAPNGMMPGRPSGKLRHRTDVVSLVLGSGGRTPLT